MKEGVIEGDGVRPYLMDPNTGEYLTISPHRYIYETPKAEIQVNSAYYMLYNNPKHVMFISMASMQEPWKEWMRKADIPMDAFKLHWDRVWGKGAELTEISLGGRDTSVRKDFRQHPFFLKFLLGSEIIAFQEMMEGAYLLNHAKKEYLDIGRHVEKISDESKNKQSCILSDPLAFLTFCGDPGDWNLMGDVDVSELRRASGRWAADVIEKSDACPCGWEEVFLEF